MKNTISDDTPGALVDDALGTFPDIDLPPSFTDDLVKRIGERLAWKVLLTEFGLKIALVAGTIGILLAGMLFPFKTGDEPFISFLLGNRQMVIVVTGVIFFTFLFDQVFLRYLFHISGKRLKLK